MKVEFHQRMTGMYEAWGDLEFDAGYLIVKIWPTIYVEYAKRYNSIEKCYGMPRIDLSPADYKIQYRGIDRDALVEYCESNILAEIRMAELEATKQCKEGFIFSADDVNDVLSYLDNPEDYEVIWAKIVGSRVTPPENFKSIGFESSWFGGDHFSPSCDCMFLSRWHGTDKEGILFKEYFNNLNECGLFSSPQIAEEFLDFYLSFDWTEHFGDYFTTEVFAQREPVGTITQIPTVMK